MASEKWLVAPGQTKTIDVEIVRALKVGLIGGKIDIIGHDEPFTRIEVHSVTGKDLKISLDGDTLEIDHPQLRWDNFIEVFASFRGSAKADVSVSVPRDVALKLGILSAEALVSGLRGGARLSTVSGDLVVDGVTGDLELNAVNGEMSIGNHVGNITAHTVSGDITASGDIRRFSVDGVSGNVFLDLDGTPDTISTNTISGNLTARLDAGVATKYHLNTVSGTMQLDEQTIRGTFGKGYESSTGPLDGSFVELRANSVSGDLSIVRRPATPAAQADTAEADTGQADTGQADTAQADTAQADTPAEASA
jgi:hypothetical protein